MRLTRLYVPGPLASHTTLRLPAGPSAHIAKVLRLRAGAAVTLFDGRGGEFEARIVALERHGVEVQLGLHQAIERESPLSVLLLQCLARNERMDWVVQKATELGVAAILPVASEHSVVRLDESSATRRSAHWQAVAVSACEQCGRNRVPQVRTSVDFHSACAEAPGQGVRWLLAPEAERSLSRTVSELAASAERATVRLLIGPEGGLSAAEQALAQQHGFLPCRLGPRILRAETAPLAALATIQALLGDL
jgi:16S rRNA (uracil1498-N3)-methyltransferase